MANELLLKSIWVIEEWKEEEHLLNKWLERYLHQEIEPTSDHMITYLPSPRLYAAFVFLHFSPSSSPPYPPYSFHSDLHEVCSCFPVPSDVIAKTRSPWQQLVTSSSPTLSFDGCFYFGGLVDVARTSLAEHQVTCSGAEGTMLPSVGSRSLHRVNNGE